MMPDRHKWTIFLTMLFSFLVYSAHLYLNPPAQEKELDEISLEGKKIWQEKNCQSCHQFYGLGGYLGPDLTNIHRRRTPEQTMAFLKHGTEIMPDFKMSNDEVQAVMAFLQAMDASGIADPKGFKPTWYGNIKTN